jgi:hypothetical protein
LSGFSDRARTNTQASLCQLILINMADRYFLRIEWFDLLACAYKWISIKSD